MHDEEEWMVAVAVGEATATSMAMVCMVLHRDRYFDIIL